VCGVGEFKVVTMIKTESLISEVLASPKSIVLVTEENFNIRYVSLTVETIFGIKPFSLLGKNAFDFVPENQREKWKQCLKETDNNGHSEITLFSTQGKELHFDISVANHTANDQIRGLVVFMHDITQRKLDLKKLESANHHLDHFIFKTTHDLRAPLHSALGLLSLAENARGAEQAKYMDMLKSSLMKLDTFIEEVNSFYKNDKLAILRERIDMRDLLNSEIDRLRNHPDAAGISIDLSVVADHVLYSDPIRLKAIISNVLSNSIKYSDSRKSNRYILIAAQVFADQLFISFEDNGIGVPEEHQEKIFDMFFRASTQTQGTGLGLYIVKDTIERLGGKIILKSKPGIGSTFVVKVPNHVSQLAALN
jgi:PAS domain S-box-containing protein